MRRSYTRALSLSRLAYDLEALLSPVIAVALLTVVGYHDLFFGTALGFVASAALVLAAALPRATSSPATPFRQRLSGGIRVFRHTPELRALAALNLGVAAATAMVLVNTVVLVQQHLARPAGVWVAALVVWMLLGAATSLILTPSARLLRRASPAATLPAVFAAQFSLSHACFILTYPMAGLVGARAGLASAALTLAVVAAAAAGLAAREFSRAEHPAAAGA